MIGRTTHLCIFRRFSLPVELRVLLSKFVVCKLTDETIKDAAFYYSKRDSIKYRYGLIEWWDTSEVTSMNNLFGMQCNFNKDISNWDVSNVTTMKHMFVYCQEFNSPLDKWDVSKVKDMNDMFACASAFNQPLGKWNVSNVTDMAGMFFKASSFNQCLNTWNVSKVIKKEIKKRFIMFKF